MAESARRLSVASLVNPNPPPDSATPMATTPTPTQTPTPIIDETDEKVLIAVTALGHMRHGGSSHGAASSSSSSSASHYWNQATPSLSPTSTRTTSPSARTLDAESDSLPDDTAAIVTTTDTVLTRVSNLPLVGSALRAYDYGKANSRVINYGAGLVESSVKAVSRPVIDRLPVDQLDEFACRQLDRLGKYGGRPEDVQSPHTPTTSEESARGRDRRPRSRGSSMSSEAAAPLPITENGEATATEDEAESSSRQVQVTNRRGWQTVLVEASGISAAISEENMKRLKYCLQWLQYATARIDAQIVILQRFLASLESSDPHALVPTASMHTLTEVKKDVVATVRQVVQVMSKYAGGALPEQARATVRNFILLLPERWASAMQAQDAQAQVGGGGGGEAGQSATTASIAAQRVLTLANESLEMMRGATGVFSESLERAEAWVERLRIVGIQRQQQRGIGSPGVNIQALSLSSNLGSRRSSRSPSMDDDDDGNHTETNTDHHHHHHHHHGAVRRRQRRRIASPSPAATARLNGLIPGMQVVE